nr:single-stranded DNA-binding protein [Aneurinibacillus sp. XH2]
MNRVNLVGRWAKDIEIRYLQDGTPVGTSTLAVEEGWGEKKKTYFFNIVLWKKTAEATSQYSGKGKRVAIDGRLTQRSWEKDGQKYFAVEVVGDQVEFLELKQSSGDPFENEGKPIDVSEDDLPF